MTDVETYIKKAGMAKNAFDFSKIQTKSLTPEWILERVTDSEIIYHFVGPFKLNKQCKSPFRKDNTPSCTFFVGNSGEIVMFDFRDKIALNCFRIVERIHNCNFNKALTIIAETFGLIDTKTSIASPTLCLEARELDRTIKKDVLIQFTKSEWKPFLGSPFSYWVDYDYSKKELIDNNIFNVDRLFLNKREIYNKSGEPRFAYVESEPGGADLVKIYMPLAKGGMKWLSTFPLDRPFGIHLLPGKSDVLIITKSKKDMVLFKRVFTDVIGLQNESLGALNMDTIKYLKSKYKSIVLCLGCDPHGHGITLQLQKRIGNQATFWETPLQDYQRFQVEDLSDYTKQYSWSMTMELLQKDKMI